MSKKNKQKLNLTSTYNLYKRTWSYMAEYWPKFLVSIVAMAIAALTEPALARVMKPLIDKGFVDQDRAAIILTPILVIIIFFVRAVASYVNESTTTWLSGTVVEKMRRLMFDRMLRLPVTYYDDNNSGRIMSRIIFDVTQITDAGFKVITVIFKDGITIIGLLALLFYTDWQLTLFCFFTLPFVLVLIRVLSHRLRKLSHFNQERYGEMTQIITEAVQGQKVVKLFSGYDYEEARFNESVFAIKSNSVKQASTSSLNSGVSQFLVACALAMILYFAASKSKNGGFTAGDFVSFITAMIMIFAPMKRITSVTQALQNGVTAAESVFKFLDVNPEDDFGKDKLNGIKKSINFENVIFKYQTSEINVLDGVNLEILHGETVALVGTSGSGKTTLVNLIPRFYNITLGKIKIDGVEIKNIQLAELRKNISLVSQDVVLFNDSVFNNIAYGGNNINEHDVIAAAKFANAWEFIEDLPKGLNTLIGENGTRLSGGQKQRLAIARAIIKNAPILILDEATSALDNQSEKQVQEALDRLMQQKRTTLVIAHRLSTVLHADKIVVMERGKIIEVGKHDELMAKNGAYASLHNVQSNWAN